MSPFDLAQLRVELARELQARLNAVECFSDHACGFRLSRHGLVHCLGYSLRSTQQTSLPRRRLRIQAQLHRLTVAGSHCLCWSYSG